MRRCYLVWHTPAELLRRRKFIKDSRLSEGAFTILHHNCYSEFLSFYFQYGQFAHFEHVAKSKVNIFAIARRETRQCVLCVHPGLARVQSTLNS